MWMMMAMMTAGASSFEPGSITSEPSALAESAWTPGAGADVTTTMVALPELPYPGALDTRRSGLIWSKVGAGLLVGSGLVMVGTIVQVNVSDSWGLGGFLGSVGLGAAGGVALAVGLPLWAVGAHQARANRRYLAGELTATTDRVPVALDRRRRGLRMTLGAVGLGAGAFWLAGSGSWVTDTAAAGMVVAAVPLGVMGISDLTSKTQNLRVRPMVNGKWGAVLSTDW